MKKFSTNKLNQYWDDIPSDKHNAITYAGLMKKWRVPKRTVREILSALACFDNGTDEILIRTSHSNGFYKTSNINEIEAFRKETLSRGLSCLAPLKKMNRIIKKEYDKTPDLLAMLAEEVNL